MMQIMAFTVPDTKFFPARLWTLLPRPRRFRIRRRPPAATLAVTARLRDGTPVRLRAIRRDDKERLHSAFTALSPRTVYQRFFHPVTASRPSCCDI